MPGRGGSGGGDGNGIGGDGNNYLVVVVLQATMRKR